MNSKFKETIFTPLLILVILVIVVAVNFIPAESIGIRDNPYLAVVVIQLLTYAIPALFYTRIRGKELTPGLRIRLFKPSHILFLFQATVLLLCGTVLISMLMYKFAPHAFELSAVTEYAAFAMNKRFFDGVYLVVAFAVLPAITEEFVFRGIVIGEYQKNGVVLASVISSAMFAMAHFSLVRFPVYFFSGIVLAIVTYTTRSVVASMLVHTINNAFVLLCEQYIINAVDKQNVSLTLLVIILIALSLLSCMFMCFEANNIYNKYSETNVESDHIVKDKRGIFQKIAKTFFSPTFLILVVVYVIACLIEP